MRRARACRRDGLGSARLARRTRAALVSDPARVALALCTRRRLERRAPVVSRGARGARGANRAGRACRVSLAARRWCDRKSRVVDEPRGVAAAQGLTPGVSSIVAVHGLWMRGTAMAALRERLAPSGLDFYNFSYPSVAGTLTSCAAALAEYVDGVRGDTVHLVGHSLGGVLIRAMLESHLPARLGRVVCLGAPLRGSRTAARLARVPGGRRLIGRCLSDVTACGG